MFLSHLECTECRTEHDARELQTVCRSCSRPLVARYDIAAARAVLDRAALARRAERSLWRYRELLPLAAGASAVTLGEGGTPLVALERLGAALGILDLRAKNESLNPTGSFKDRGMAVAVSMARALGATALAAPSAGNAGGSLAAYGARAGLPVTIAMPVDVPAANRLEAEACGARVELIPGTITDCGAWIRARTASEGWFDVSTLKEPYRVEGKKTMGYELAEQLEWTLPDAILYPTGGGTGLVGMWKAFDELEQLGWIEASRRPRMIAVQASGCAPIAGAFRSGSDDATPPARARTVASGLRVPAPIGDRWMLRVLRASCGSAIAISDSELIAASRRLASTEGIFPAPEAGALVAALEQLLASGEIRGDERVVLFITGTGLKYPEAFDGG